MDRMHLHHPDVLDGERLLYVKSPQAGTDKWANAAAAGQTAFTEGVRDTNVDVVGRAVAQQGVLLRNFTDAVMSGRWARRLGEVGTAGWKSRTIAKAGNYGTGIAASKDKYLAAAQKLYPYIEQMRQTVHAMPKGSLADSKARASAAIDIMAAFKNQG